jgi:hypothetical protein
MFLCSVIIKIAGSLSIMARRVVDTILDAMNAGMAVMPGAGYRDKVKGLGLSALVVTLVRRFL